MKVTSKYNKSEIMTRAWELSRIWVNVKGMSFAYCLSRAWGEAKAEQKRIERVAQVEAERIARYNANMEVTSRMTASEIHYATMASHYATGAYSGD